MPTGHLYTAARMRLPVAKGARLDLPAHEPLPRREYDGGAILVGKIRLYKALKAGQRKGSAS